MRADSGFTIVENLVALAILSVALVLLYSAGANSLAASRHANTVDEAIALAQSKLDEVAAMHTALPARSSGIFPDSNVHWTITATAIPDGGFASKSLALQSGQLELEWQDGIHRQTLAVETRHLGLTEP